VWNKNSWHWEEKNYGKWAEEHIGSLLTSFTLDGPHGTIRLHNPTVNGEASVSVRKGKRIAAYEYKLDCQWSGEAPSGEAVNGTLAVPDFSVESVQDDDYEVRVNVQTSSDAATALKEYLRKDGAKKLRAHLRQFHDAINTAESEPDRLEADKKRREEELARMQAAQQTTGEAKLKMLEQTKAEEARKREAKAQQPPAQAPAQAPAAEAPQRIEAQPEGKGSVWNVNSWQWEERPMTQWAEKHLTHKLQDTQLTLLDGSTSVSLLDPKIKGDASSSIRKGKKLLVFDLSLTVAWSATRREPNGDFMADAKGRIEVPDFSSESLGDIQVKVTCDQKEAPREIINQAMRKEGVDQLKTILLSFVDEMRQA